MSEKKKTDLMDKFTDYIVKIFSLIDPNTIVEWIKANKLPIGLLKYIDFDTLPGWLGKIRQVIINRRNEYIPTLTSEKCIELAKKHEMNDYVKIFEHPKGRKWLERCLKLIKFILMNIELSNEELISKFYEALEKKEEKKTNITDKLDQ